MQSSPLNVAIQNLTDVCEAVLLASGYASVRTGRLWTNEHYLDIPYPNLITLSDGHDSPGLYAEISTYLASRQTNSVTAVNDTHSSLDLTPFGLKVLFSNPWFFRQPDSVSDSEHGDLDIVEVDSPAWLAEFEKSSYQGFGKEWTDRSYSPVLIEDSRFRFYAGYIEGQIVSGVQTFNNRTSLGFYTLFTIPSARRRGFGDAVIRAGLSDSPGLPAVTNPSEMSNGIFGGLGFEEVGKRTVWLSSK